MFGKKEKDFVLVLVGENKLSFISCNYLGHDMLLLLTEKLRRVVWNTIDSQLISGNYHGPVVFCGAA